MKKNNRISYLLIFCLALIFSIQITCSAKAISNTPAKIISAEIPVEAIKFAEEEFPRHKSTLIRSEEKYNFKNNKVEDFSLGAPFNIFCYENNEITNPNIYHFPILENEQIVGVFSVAKTKNNKYTATLSKSFADELNEILINDKDSTFRLCEIDKSIVAISDTTTTASILLENIASGKELDLDSLKLNKINKLFNNNQKTKKYKEVSTHINEQNIDKVYSKQLVTPIESLLLRVPIVSQCWKPWCWAATCASIINYTKCENLSAADVVRYVKGSEVDEGGTYLDEVTAYKHWGLKGEDFLDMSYQKTKDYIKTSYPLHVSFWSNQSGHSMTLRGFEEYSSENKIYSLIDPNRNDYISITAYDNGKDVAYIPGNNQVYYWNNAIKVTRQTMR